MSNRFKVGTNRPLGARRQPGEPKPELVLMPVTPENDEIHAAFIDLQASKGWEFMAQMLNEQGAVLEAMLERQGKSGIEGLAKYASSNLLTLDQALIALTFQMRGMQQAMYSVKTWCDEYAKSKASLSERAEQLASRAHTQPVGNVAILGRPTDPIPSA